MKTFKATVETFYICHSIDIVHYGVLEPGQEVSTGQDQLETFTKESEYLNRLQELGINPDQD